MCTQHEESDLPETFDVLSKRAHEHARWIVANPDRTKRFLIEAGILLEDGTPVPELHPSKRRTHLY